MNAEQLRTIYNERYGTTDDRQDRWSCTDPTQAKQIAQAILRFVGKTEAQGMKVLDVGCAKGVITEAFRQNNCDAYGLDYADVAVQIAQQRFPACHFWHMDGFNPTLPSSHFDLILMRGFSGINTNDMDSVVKLIRTYLPFLVPKGVLVISTTFGKPNQSDSSWQSWHKAELHKLSTLITDATIKLHLGEISSTWQAQLVARLSFALGRRKILPLWVAIQVQ